MRIDAAGFARPIVLRPISDEDHRKIVSICPGISLVHESSTPAGVDYHPIWGPVKKLAAGYARDTRVRHRASSGGLLSAMLVHLLESRKVDYVLHIRVSADDPFRNDAVISSTANDVLLGAGSRYAPASPVALLGTALKMNGKFAFVGKPCDVAAVRRLLVIRPELQDRVPYLLSFMCAGTPSIIGTHEVIKQLGLGQKIIKSFRYRGDGWPGLTKAEALDGTVASMDYNTSWGQILNRHLQLRCKICPDGTGEFADVVCADAWYGKGGYPDFAEREGRSLLITRTARGGQLVKEAADSIVLEPFGIDDLRQIQPYQFHRKASIVARIAAMRLFGRRVPRYTGLHLRRAMWHIRPFQLLREFLGTGKRVIGGRL
ncbi:Coenzyme F420 hydrogenase/dehydrogenase, beta subunit C-terminal domain [Aquincola agrisoli]|uniref:Coenzyme F420 hydrogenase/dehydrogenase, beta subunit C-terminal domain n=1 Tax=Aquincola TaxID=391952 RepID=UPI002FBE943A